MPRGRPKKTEAEKEATRKAAVARRRERRREIAEAKKQGKPIPEAPARQKAQTPKGKPKKKPKPKPKPAPEPKLEGFAGMDRRAKLEHIKSRIHGGEQPHLISLDLDIPVSTVERYFREVTGETVARYTMRTRGPSEADLRDADDNRLAQLARRRKARQLTTSIGDIPEPENPEIKRLCRTDLQLFLQWYFPQSCGLGPYGPPQIAVIERIERACFRSARYLSLLPRGYSKSALSLRAILWAMLYGHSSYSVFLAANDELASEAIGAIKTELMSNPRLAADFPEVVVAIRALDNKPQRAMGLNHNGRLLWMKWSSDCIAMPTVDGSPASGCVLVAKGIEAAARGLNFTRPDGSVVRPQLVVGDDLQTEKTAKSVPATNQRLEILKKAVSRLGGHGFRTSVLINGTILRNGDLMDRMSDRKLFPGWQKVLTQMCPEMPSEEVLHKHWLGPYRDLLVEYDEDDIDGQVKAEIAALEYYREHREEMDEGFSVSWPSIPLEQNEISAIQHAMNIYILDGADVFHSECQNKPMTALSTGAMEIGNDVAERFSGYARGCVPNDAPHLVFGVDVHKEILYWVVAAIQSDFTGYIVDYGAFPEQPDPYQFTHATVRKTLQMHLDEPAPERAIQLGVEDLVHDLLHREWRTQNGDPIGISCGLVDVGFKSTEVANALRRLLPASEKVLMSRGVGIGARSKPMPEYDLSAKRVIKAGPDPRRPRWILPTTGRDGVLYRVDHDSNFWKSTLAARLNQSSGPGRWELFGAKDGPDEDHSMLVSHLMCEKPQDENSAGRTVSVWAPSGHRENHWFDCSVMCCVAASLSGAQLPTAPVKPTPHAPVVVAPPPQNAGDEGSFDFFATARQ